MATVTLSDYLPLLAAVQRTPQGFLWSSYDAEADVLYISFKKPCHATDSELTDEDVIIRYEGDEVVGLTILHASKRLNKSGCAVTSWAGVRAGQPKAFFTEKGAEEGGDILAKMPKMGGPEGVLDMVTVTATEMKNKLGHYLQVALVEPVVVEKTKHR
jgi:uncharacterized protein YuzE